jgi:large subunit ribosomal protein L32e
MKFLKRIREDQIKALIQAGYTTVDELKQATKEDLANVKGLDPKLVRAILKDSASFKHKEFTELERRLLHARTRHDKPWFKRDDYEKKKKLRSSWRRPKGLFNKMRRGFPDKGPVVQVGYGSPKAIRGYHPSGFREVLVHNPSELESLLQDQAVRVAGAVGRKKKELILEKAFAKGLKVLNPAVNVQFNKVREKEQETASKEEEQ